MEVIKQSAMAELRPVRFTRKYNMEGIQTLGDIALWISTEWV